MKVAIVGATGNAGSCLVKELVSRGHEVTAIARHAEKVAGPNVTVKSLDASDGEALSAALRGHDAVISSLRFIDTDAAALIAAVKRSGVKRYAVVGGAASLYAPGTTMRLIDGPDFPDMFKPEAGGGAKFLDLLKQESELDWVFLSPSMMFVGTERTGKFRLGKDELLVAADGNSSISFPDFAIALVDELETPKHHRERFTVGY